MDSIKKLDEYCRMRNKSIRLNRDNQVIGFRPFDYYLSQLKEVREEVVIPEISLFDRFIKKNAKAAKL